MSRKPSPGPDNFPGSSCRQAGVWFAAWLWLTHRLFLRRCRRVDLAARLRPYTDRRPR